ncbi:hypothetical protein HDV57DRAFT_194088 [Trichoderma longibrachiatum]
MTKPPSPLEVHIYRALPTLTIAYTFCSWTAIRQNRHLNSPTVERCTEAARTRNIHCELYVSLCSSFYLHQCLLQAHIRFSLPFFSQPAEVRYQSSPACLAACERWLPTHRLLYVWRHNARLAIGLRARSITQQRRRRRRINRKKVRADSREERHPLFDSRLLEASAVALSPRRDHSLPADLARLVNGITEEGLGFFRDLDSSLRASQRPQSDPKQYPNRRR